MVPVSTAIANADGSEGEVMGRRRRSNDPAAASVSGGRGGATKIALAAAAAAASAAAALELELHPTVGMLAADEPRFCESVYALRVAVSACVSF